MKEYHDLVEHILNVGEYKENRTGIATLSSFNYNYSINLEKGFPLLTTKKMNFKSVVMELLWFLSGETNNSFLKKHSIKFWEPWTDENGEVLNQYGPSWTKFSVTIDGKQEHFNQILWLLNEIKTNPTSRRLVLNAWQPGISNFYPLPPCHLLAIFNVQGNKLNLHLTQRSADIALGVPFNIACYSLLLQIFAHLTNLEPGFFAHSIVDAHIYTKSKNQLYSDYDHVPKLKEQLQRNSFTPPKLTIQNLSSYQDILDLLKQSEDQIMSHFILSEYKHHPFISFKPAV